MLFDVIGMENANLSDKSGQIWLWKKIIVIWNNTPETMTKQQRCLEKKKQVKVYRKG